MLHLTPVVWLGMACHCIGFELHLFDIVLTSCIVSIENSKLCNGSFVSYLLKTASNQLSEEEMIEKALQMSRLEYMQSKGI